MKNLTPILVLLFLVVACAPQSMPQQNTPATPESTQPAQAATVPIKPVSPPAVTPISQPEVAPVVTPVTAPVLVTPPVAKTHQVSISEFKFVPASLQVNVGDTVIWTNQDDASHTVKMSTWTSEEMFKGDTTQWTAMKAGTVNYICSIHTGMKGSVTVV